MRRIKQARITFISLVPRGANQLPVLYKSEGDLVQFNPIVKNDRFEEEGLLTAVVYVPEVPDSQGDVASAEVIKDMAHRYVQNVGAVDIRHDTKALPREQVSIVESFIVQKNDARFADLRDYNGRAIDATGGWAVVIKVEDQNLRALYRSGQWNGVSMFGDAIVEPVSKSDTSIPDALAKRLAGGSTNPNTNDTDMTIDELKAALSASNDTLAKTLTESIVTGLAKALKPEPTQEPKNEPVAKIDFEGDPTNLEDVRKHQRKVRASLVKWDDAKSVQSYEADLAKWAAEDAARVAAQNGDKAPELIAAEAALAKAQAELARVSKASNQPTDTKPTSGNESGLSKEDQTRMKAGSRMAQFINGK